VSLIKVAKAFQMKLDSIQPSQLYISSKKLDSIVKSIERSKPVFVEPIPIKKLGNQVVFVDGHTRALAAFLLGLSEVPVARAKERSCSGNGNN
jgi:ParB-like chromosome segregation protein Spo0J